MPMQLEPYHVETFPSDYKNHYIHVLKFGNILGKTDMEKKKVIASVLGMYAIHPEAMSNLQGDLIVTRETHDETPEHTIQVVNFVMKRLNELLKLDLEPTEPSNVISPIDGKPSGKGYFLLRIVDLKDKKSQEILVDKKVVMMMHNPTNAWGLLVTQILENMGVDLDGD